MAISVVSFSFSRAAQPEVRRPTSLLDDGFLYRILSLTDLVSELNHQAEITVMQCTGHSLPVHQSMSVPWDFYLVPFFSVKPAYAIFSHNCHRNVSLPSGASLWNGMFDRVKGQYTTHRCGRTAVIQFNPELGDKGEGGQNTFSVRSKVNLIERLGFKLIYLEVAVQHDNHYSRAKM